MSLYEEITGKKKKKEEKKEKFVAPTWLTEGNKTSSTKSDKTEYVSPTALQSQIKSTVAKRQIQDIWSNGYDFGDVTKTILKLPSLLDTINPVTMAKSKGETTANSIVETFKNPTENLLKATKAKKEAQDIWSNGYQFGDITKTIGKIEKAKLGTIADVGANLAKGELQTAEGIVDTGRYLVSDIADIVGADKYSQKVRQRAIQNTTGVILGTNDMYNNPKQNGLLSKIDENSIFGNDVDSIVESVGQQAFRVGLANIAPTVSGKPMGETATKVLNNIEIFAGSYGSAKSEALMNGADYKTATLRGFISGTAEYISEHLDEGLFVKTGSITGKLKGDIAKGVEKTFESKLMGKLALGVLSGIGEGLEEQASSALETIGTDIVNYLNSDYTYGLTNGQGLDKSASAWQNVKKLWNDATESWTSEEAKASKNAAFWSTLITFGVAQANTNINKNQAINAVAKDNNISVKDATKIYDAVMEARMQEVSSKTNYEDLYNIENKMSAELSEKIKSGEINSQELVKEYDSKMRFMKAVGTGMVSSEGLNLIDSYRAYNGNESDINNIKTIQESLQNRNINSRFDATYFTNNNENSMWITENGQQSVIFNPNANNDTIIQDLAVHELSHDIFSQKTQAGKNLYKEVLNYAKTDENYKSMRAELENLYGEYYDRNSKDFANKIDEEIVAKYLGKNLGTQEYVNRLVGDKPNLATRIYNWVKEKLNSIGETAEQKEERIFWKSVEDKFEKAYNEQKKTIKKRETAYSLADRVTGDQLLDAQDLIDEVKSVGANVDENGYITLYHQTSKENADKIKQSGIMTAKEDAVFFSTSKDAQQAQGRGEEKLEFKIPAEKLLLDDLFSDNADVKISLNGKGQIDVSEYLVDNTKTNYRGSHQIENAKSITELNLDDVKNKVIEIDGYLTNQAQSDLKKLQKILKNPNEIVKIYRAAPVNKLNSGDWVTTDRSYAQNVANNNGGKVYTFEVKASDLYYPDNVRELPSLHRLSSFQYNGDNVNNNQTRYSLSVSEANTGKDNQGRELSKGQQEYFKNSKATDENGDLVTVYHTMTNVGNQFNEFNPVGTDYYRFGEQVVNYFTDNQDMSGSYADQEYKKAYTKPIKTYSDVQDFIDFQNTQSDSLVGVNGITNHYIIEKDGDGYIVKQNPSGKEFLSYVNLSDEGKVALDRVRNNENLHKQFLNTDDSIKVLKNQLEEWYNTRQYDGYPELAQEIDVYDRECGKLISQANTYGEQRVIQQMLKMDLEEYLFGEKEFTKEQIDSALEHTLTKTFENEKDLINNIQDNFKGKYQYAGYLNMTNPYVIETLGENWDSILRETNQTRYDEYQRVVSSQEIKNKLYELAQESEKLNREYRQTNQERELSEMTLAKNKINNSELRETINDLGMFNFNYEEWIEAGKKNAEMFGEEFKTNLPNGNELIINYMEDLNPAEQEIVKDMTISEFVSKYGKLNEENNKFGDASSYFKDQFKKVTGTNLDTNAIGYRNMYDLAKYNFDAGSVQELLEDRLTTNDLVKRIIEKNKTEGTDYDGLIMKDVYDYGGQSKNSYRTTGNIYVTFNSNQFKAVDNLNPTQDADIRYDRSTQNEIAPVTEGTRTTFGELFNRDYAPVREDISDLREQMNNLSKQIETLQSGAENKSKGYVETYKPQKYEKQGYNALTEQDADLYQESLMNDENYIKSLNEQADYTEENKTLVKNITDEVRNQLGLGKKQTELLKNIVSDALANDLTADEIANKLQEQFSQQTYTIPNEEAKDIKKLIKQTPINVSDDIKRGIADYGDFKNRNFNKISFMRNGLPVDLAYQQLSEQAPGYFPSDIINPTDQLLRISDVANMMNEISETIEIPSEKFDDIADYINNAITDEIFDRLTSSQATLDTNIQYGNTEDIAPTTIRSQESIDETIANRDIAPVKETKQKTELRTKLENAYRQTQEMFANRNHMIDQMAKDYHNDDIKVAGDVLNNVAGEVQYNLNYNQTDINGIKTGEALHKLFAPARQAGLYEVLNDYLFNVSNIERHAVGKGSQVPLEVSKQLVSYYEQTYPQLKTWAKDIYKYEDNEVRQLADAGVITEELYEKLRGENGMYRSHVPFYNDNNIDNNRYFDENGNVKPVSPLKRAKGGASDVSQLLAIEDAMARQTYNVKKAIRQNELYKQIVSSLEKYDDFLNEDLRKNPTDIDSSLYVDDNGDKVLSAYVDGEKVSAIISDELYNELAKTNENRVRQLEQTYSMLLNPIQKTSGVVRNLITSWNPAFLARNAIKDIQDAVINSKHTTDMLKNFLGNGDPRKSAIMELAQAKTQEAQQFLALYGVDNTYGDYSNISDSTNMFKKGINKIASINELVELAPRYAEFKASLQNGESITQAIYNAREVTTNFGRGGYITKALNRNGFNFLNASVQGFDKMIRNITGQNGVKGVTAVVLKGAAFSVLPSILNHLLFGTGDDKDEEYEALPDYIKDNYYLIKLTNGKFIRIPKGRITAVLGSAARRSIEAVEGEEDAFSGYLSNSWNQVGVGDLGNNNIFAPIKQAVTNKAWHGGDIVPTRLQNLPAGEQSDEKTDALSKFIGEKLNISPKKINYVLDQYSGAIGDVLLPVMTPATTSGASGVGYLTAPLESAFVVNSTDSNKYSGEFYDTKDELQKNSNSAKATDEDKLKYKYMSVVSKQLSDLYAERREVQADTTLSKADKYKKVQSIQNEINSLAKQALTEYKTVNQTDTYASIGDVQYYKDKNGEWTKVSDSDDEFTAGMTQSEKTAYYNTKNKLSQINEQYKGSDSKAKLNKKEEITQAITYSGLDNYSKAMLYSKYYSSEKAMRSAANAGYDIDTYITALNDIEQLRDKYSQAKGYSTEYRKSKTISYINSLNMNVPQKAMLIRQYYSSYRTYNNNIVNYVGNLDLSYEEKKEILESTGMTVNGNKVTWK